MIETESKKANTTEPAFKLNYATVILLLVILIPVVYTVVTNLQPATPPPSITPATPTTPAKSSNSAAPLESALKAVADNPGFQSYLNLGLVYYNAANYA